MGKLGVDSLEGSIQLGVAFACVSLAQEAGNGTHPLNTGDQRIEKHPGTRLPVLGSGV